MDIFMLRFLENSNDVNVFPSERIHPNNLRHESVTYSKSHTMSYGRLVEILK